MDVLWAPWRMAYIGAPKAEQGCILCAATSGDRRERLVLGTTVHSLVLLNRYPYQNGHLLGAPRRHTADLPSLPAGQHGGRPEALRRAHAPRAARLHPAGSSLRMRS